MKKLIQEFRMALAFNGQPKDNSVKELQSYIARQETAIGRFFELFDEIERKEQEPRQKLPNIFKDNLNYFKGSFVGGFYNKYQQEKEKCQCIKYFNGVSFTNLWQCDKCKNESNPLYEKAIDNALKEQHKCNFVTVDKAEYQKEWVLIKRCDCSRIEKVTINKQFNDAVSEYF